MVTVESTVLKTVIMGTTTAATSFYVTVVRRTCRDCTKLVFIQEGGDAYRQDKKRESCRIDLGAKRNQNTHQRARNVLVEGMSDGDQIVMDEV